MKAQCRCPHNVHCLSFVFWKSGPGRAAGLRARCEAEGVYNIYKVSCDCTVYVRRLSRCVSACASYSTLVLSVDGRDVVMRVCAHLYAQVSAVMRVCPHTCIHGRRSHRQRTRRPAPWPARHDDQSKTASTKHAQGGRWAGSRNEERERLRSSPLSSTARCHDRRRGTLCLCIHDHAKVSTCVRHLAGSCDRGSSWKPGWSGRHAEDRPPTPAGTSWGSAAPALSCLRFSMVVWTHLMPAHLYARSKRRR